jgi:hypothetical protein
MDGGALLKDVVIGGIVFGLISLSSVTLGNSSRYYKVSGFLWALPVTFPFMLSSVRTGARKYDKEVETTTIDFLNHGVLGAVIGVLVQLLYIQIIKTSKDVTFAINSSIILFIVICTIYIIVV